MAIPRGLVEPPVVAVAVVSGGILVVAPAVCADAEIVVDRTASAPRQGRRNLVLPVIVEVAGREQLTAAPSALVQPEPADARGVADRGEQLTAAATRADHGTVLKLKRGKPIGDHGGHCLLEHLGEQSLAVQIGGVIIVAPARARVRGQACRTWLTKPNRSPAMDSGRQEAVIAEQDKARFASATYFQIGDGSLLKRGPLRWTGGLCG
jgi:hypothetical protein